ncbi:MAG: HAD-IC family P-type ATPase, partial [Calothrix sp. SM1_5_4]|nr:HAD-IC family P-type ATPase [Calothrix sp. SM1_5_4]
ASGHVFGAALIFLVAYWSVSPEQAVQRSLALIILACPCAMAFGTPLAFAVSLRRAQRAGIIVRDANIFEKVRDIKTVFFDKTGTLTDTELSFMGNPKDVPGVYQKIVLSLENESLHPIAFAFRKTFQTNHTLPPADGWKEIPGVGVSGFVYGRFYELKRDKADEGETGCTLFEDEKPLMTFRFQARLKPDCHATLQGLRERGYDLKLLSGDQSSSVVCMGRLLGFKETEIHYGLSPAQKAEIIATTPRSMMIGDGVNDSLALMKADVGLAVSGGVAAALQSADAYLTDPGLRGVISLMDTSRFAFATIQQNLFISVVYNSVGGTLALLGYVNPFVAALLMPVSSGFILLSTWLRGRQT